MPTTGNRRRVWNRLLLTSSGVETVLNWLGRPTGAPWKWPTPSPENPPHMATKSRPRRPRAVGSREDRFPERRAAF